MYIINMQPYKIHIEEKEIMKTTRDTIKVLQSVVEALVVEDQRFIEYARDAVAAKFDPPSMLAIRNSDDAWINAYRKVAHSVVLASKDMALLSLIPDHAGLFSPERINMVKINLGDYNGVTHEHAAQVIKLLESHVEMIILVTVFIVTYGRPLREAEEEDVLETISEFTEMTS